MSNRNGGTLKVPGRPWKFSDAELAPPGDPAMQGEHNDAVLAELRYDPAGIDQSQARGALVGNATAG